jgi:hypothetical protein
MRSQLSLLAFVLMAANAQACSCWETTGIGNALSRAEIVVLAQVVRHDEPRTEADYLAPAIVKVIKVLKGDAGKEMVITSHWMCGGTFGADDLGDGETFVLATSHETPGGAHILPGCSHSGLKLVNDQLFTNESVGDGSWRLTPYMSLTMLELLLPWGLLDTRNQFVLAASIVLLLSLTFTRRVRGRNIVASPVERRALMNSLRLLRWRSRLAVAWILFWAGCLLFAGIKELEWILMVAGTLFAIAAVGIAFRWSWSEGLAYGLALLFIGWILFAIYSGLAWYFSQFDSLSTRLVLFIGGLLLCLAATVWCIYAVRHRFNRETH